MNFEALLNIIFRNWFTYANMVYYRACVDKKKTLQKTSP